MTRLFVPGVCAVLVVATATSIASAQGRGSAAPNYDAFYELGPDSLVRRGVPKGKVAGPSTLLSGIGTYVDLAGGHVYPEKVAASERKPIRIFMIDARNDNRGLNAEGQYEPKRDWFYQNVRLRDALVAKGYDVNYAWGIGVHSHDMGGAMLPEMLGWLWRDQPVSVDPRDTAERSFRR
jgi:hypothetical protein